MSVEDWSKYWRGSVGAALTSDGVNHPSVDQFWLRQTELIDELRPKVFLDLACGRGGVMSLLDERLPQSCLRYCLDYSYDAVRSVKELYPGGLSLVGDASCLPFQIGSLDLIVSQFGIEYAGADALIELCNYCSTNSVIMLLMHDRNGSIAKDSELSITCINYFLESNILAGARNVVGSCSHAIRTGSMGRYKTAIEDYQNKVDKLNTILLSISNCSGKSTINSFLNDFDKVHARIEFYSPVEVLDWVEILEGEIISYAGRLSSMLNAAIDAGVFNTYLDHYTKRGFKPVIAEPLTTKESELSLAYSLVMTR